jgi:hypothetical protein
MVVVFLDGFAKKKRACLVMACAGALWISHAFAQYKDYPKQITPIQTLSEDALPSWMTLDMELRERTEYQSSIDYTPGADETYDLTRIRGGMKLKPFSWLTGYVQFQESHSSWLPPQYQASDMQAPFSLRQGYLKFRYKQVQLTAGRQELEFGDQRLIGVSDWTNTGRTFDGFDIRIGDKNRVDLFSASVVDFYPTAFTTHWGGLNYHGVYGSISTWIPRTRLEPFVLIKAMPSVLSHQNRYGTETEVTPGIHALGTTPGNFDYEVTGALQRGSYSNDSIHAGAGYAKVGYTASHLPWTPHLVGEYDYATGDNHNNPQRIGTFDQQYPSSHDVFGLVDLFGWQNIKQTRVNLDLNPYRHVTLLLQAGSLAAATTKDGLYNDSGVLFLKPPATGFASSRIGTEFDASAKYVLLNSLVTNIGVGHFFPGQIMTENNHGAPLTYAYLSFTYRFKIK